MGKARESERVDLEGETGNGGERKSGEGERERESREGEREWGG